MGPPPCLSGRPASAEVTLLPPGGGWPRTTLHRFTIGRVPIEILDYEGSQAARFVASELDMDHYGLRRISFAPGDVVVDVGGHIGLFSILLSLCHPGLVIHAFEPFPDNYWLFQRNLELHPAARVQLHPQAITSDGRALEMASDPANSGGSTAHAASLTHRRVDGIPSCTLDVAFSALGIASCKLLKLDCEGAEHEIVQATRVLTRVEYLSAEVHTNRWLASKGCSLGRFRMKCLEAIDAAKLTLTSNTISD